MNQVDDLLKIVIYRPKPALKTIWANWLFKSEPLEIEYLYTVLHDLAEVIPIDGQVSNLNLNRIVRSRDVDIVLITSLITNINSVLRIAGKLKKLKNPPLIFVGGPHAEVVPEHFFCTEIDGVFYNDQLTGIRSVIKAIISKRDYKSTPGAAFPTNDEFKLNDVRKVNYSEFPIPLRPLLNQYSSKYNLFYFDRCATIKTSFGCPEQCTFCFCRKMNLTQYQRRPLTSVIEELESIPNENIFIVDDNFLISPSHLIAFCEEIERKKIQKKFIVYATAHFIAKHKEIMKRLKAAGLAAVLVGFEFLDDDDLKNHKKGSTTRENSASIAVCEELEIELIALFMINSNWTKYEFQKLAKYVSKNRIFLATFATVTTLPGTDLWEMEDRQTAIGQKWWRYDLLRLHEDPLHMSSFQYYLWLTYLYIRLAYRTDALKHFYRQGGVWKTAKMIANVHLSILDFLLKVIIWP